MRKEKYKTPEFMLFCLNADDVIRTSEGQGGSTPGADNDWNTDIGEWDTEM